MRKLIVGICTFRRPFLEKTIRSVDAQTGTRADTILVIDNDDTPSAKELTEGLARELDSHIIYKHVPGRNISIARNAALDVANGEWLAFIDDDEIATPQWLTLLTRAKSPESAAVFGPVLADYPDHAPNWMTDLRPHGAFIEYENGEIATGHSGNVLLDLSHPVLVNLRFHENFGRVHGSDNDYFRKAFADGARFVEAPGAVIHEPVPDDRMSLGWLVRRRFHFGHAYVQSAGKSRLPLAFTASAKAAYCGLISLLNLPRPKTRYRYLLRGTLHVGVVCSALGYNPKEYYGKSANP